MEKPHKKKREGRRAYLDDFIRTANGEYEYTGVTYAFQGGKKERRGCILFLGGAALGSAAAAVISGCFPVPGMDNCPYVILPYVFSLLAACFLLWSAGRLAAGGEPLRRYVYRATVEQFPLRSGLAAAGAGLALGGEGLYLLLNGAGEKAAGAAGFFLCQGLALAGALLFRRRSRAMGWTPSHGEG